MGGCESPERLAWRGMLRRCLDPHNRDYPEYGGRGITVYDPWQYNFFEFLAAMGPRPDGRYSLDRIDNEKGYFPGNVRWATAKEQANNRRRPRRLHENSLKVVEPWLAVGLSRRTWYRYGKPTTRDEAADATRRAAESRAGY